MSTSFSMSNNETCACGKNLKQMNKHNRQLHFNTCKKRKLSQTNLKINKFFRISSTTPSNELHNINTCKYKNTLIENII